MVADLVDEHMRHEVAEGFLVLGPVVQDRAPVEPHHVGQLTGLEGGGRLGEAGSAKQAEEIEGRFAVHLPQGLVVGEVVDPDRDALAQAPEALRQARKGVNTLDIAKRLIDYGFHPMTIYFPLIVQGAMLIEPTESVGRQELQQFIDAMHEIAREAVEDPELVRNAPHTTRIGRLDDAAAARKPVLRWRPATDAVSA